MASVITPNAAIRDHQKCGHIERLCMATGSQGRPQGSIVVSLGPHDHSLGGQPATKAWISLLFSRLADPAARSPSGPIRIGEESHCDQGMGAPPPSKAALCMAAF